jgi:hypothetical protein
MILHAVAMEVSVTRDLTGTGAHQESTWERSLSCRGNSQGKSPAAGCVTKLHSQEANVAAAHVDSGKVSDSRPYMRMWVFLRKLGSLCRTLSKEGTGFNFCFL